MEGMLKMVIRILRRHSIMLCACILACTVILTLLLKPANQQPEEKEPVAVSRQSQGENQAADVFAPNIEERTEEMRGVWVPYMSLSMSGETDRSEAAFRAKFQQIIDVSKEKRMNTLIVHVRPFSDALYRSELFPWSHILTGTQGQDPGYDPLAIMCEMAHAADMEIHAWVNPLRIQVNGTPEELCEDNIFNVCKRDEERQDWVVETSGGKYLNPAYPGVCKLVADGVGEIVRNYEIDGVQFHDYFYPTEDEAFDQQAYEAYCAQAQKSGTALSRSDWRLANINAMVSLVYQTVKAENKTVVFGISPQGNFSNNQKLGADVEKWCSVRGYVDYICPQIYVNFDNPALPFAETAEAWRDLVTASKVDLYLGLAVYKAGSDADEGTWKQSDDIIAKQVDLGRELSYDGFMFYSWEYLDTEQTKEEVQNVMKVLEGED